MRDIRLCSEGGVAAQAPLDSTRLGSAGAEERSRALSPLHSEDRRRRRRCYSQACLGRCNVDRCPFVGMADGAARSGRGDGRASYISYHIISCHAMSYGEGVY